MRLVGVEPGGFASGNDVDVPDPSELPAVNPEILSGPAFDPIPCNRMAHPFAHRNSQSRANIPTRCVNQYEMSILDFFTDSGEVKVLWSFA